MFLFDGSGAKQLELNKLNKNKILVGRYRTWLKFSSPFDSLKKRKFNQIIFINMFKNVRLQDNVLFGTDPDQNRVLEETPRS